MKHFVKLTAVILLICMTLCACNNTGNDTSSQDTSAAASETSSEDTSSKDTSSKNSSSKEDVDLTQFLSEDGFLDVQAASKVLKKGSGDSHLFAEGVEGLKGYEINGGVYQVDAATMTRLTKTPVRGDGSVMLLGWSDLSKGYGDHPDQFKAAPVEKLHDPIFMSMYLPSEGTCFLKTLKHGYNIFPASDKYVNVVSLGAIYKNYDYDLKDDDEITICVGRSKLLMRTTKSDGWFAADDSPRPDIPSYIYYLPWQLEGKLGVYPISSDRITYFDDHVEIRLKGSDLNATAAKKTFDEVQECVLHFWGNFIDFNKLKQPVKGSEVLGVLSSFEVWVKEPEFANYLVIGVGADWRDKNGTINMAFESLKYTLTNEKRIAFAHSVSPSVYDEVMDVEKVEELLGMK